MKFVKKILVVCIFVIFLFVFDFLLNKNHFSSPCQRFCPFTSKFEKDRLVFDYRRSIRHFPDFICPQNFRNLADWVYGWKSQFFESIDDTTQNGTEIAPCLPDGSIIYVRSIFVNEFFVRIYPNLINKFVLITGEGDETMPHDISVLDRIDSKIIHWFGQNGGIEAERSSKFTHIPIGINCYEMADAIRKIQKRSKPVHFHSDLFKIDDEPTDFPHPVDVTKRILSNPSIKNDSFILINFEQSTDPTGFRHRIFADYCHSKEQNPLVKCIRKPGGVQIFRLAKIYERNRQFPLWLSPRGNGIDCHRTWEALYLDIVPIVWNNSLRVLYKDLPMIVINDHRNLTREFFYNELMKISKEKQKQSTTSSSTGFRYEKLRNSYWRRLILNKSRYAMETPDWKYRRRCWRAKSSLLEWSRYLPFLKYF